MLATTIVIAVFFAGAALILGRYIVHPPNQGEGKFAAVLSTMCASGSGFMIWTILESQPGEIAPPRVFQTTCAHIALGFIVIFGCICVVFLREAMSTDLLKDRQPLRAAWLAAQIILDVAGGVVEVVAIYQANFTEAIDDQANLALIGVLLPFACLMQMLVVMVFHDLFIAGHGSGSWFSDSAAVLRRRRGGDF
jgi:hypothetical protein